jgi:hypothetical protein
VISRRIAAVVVLLAVRAQAAPATPVIAALAPGDRDARESVALGPNGQAYEPDGKGAWIRHHAGGIADEITRATRAGALVIAGVDGGPPYAYRVGRSGTTTGEWNLVVLGLRAKAVLGRGPRATAAVGPQVFGLDTGKPVRLADAPGPVTMLAASARGVVIETDKGLAKLEGKRWKPIANVPSQVTALLDDRWALVEHGLVDLRTQNTTPWPAGFKVASVFAVDNDLVIAAGMHGANPEVVTLKAGKLDRAGIVIAATVAGSQSAPAIVGAGIVAIVGDRAGRVVVATHDALWVRDPAGAWTAGALRDDLPADRPGSPPAESK